MEYVYLNKEVICNNIRNLTQVTFEVTDACNLQCKYCGYGELYEGYDTRECKTLPIEQAYSLLEYLYSNWQQSDSHHKKTYISFYGGEPLLNMDFIRGAVSWIMNHQIPQCDFVFTMTTNGMLLDRYIDYLVEHDFKILVSLDGNRENDGYRVDFSGCPSFDRVFANIKSVQQHYPDFFEKNMEFNSVLHNLNDYQCIITFFQKEFNKIPSVSELSISGVKEERKEEYLKMRNDKFSSFNKVLDKERLKNSLFMNVPEISILCTYLHAYSGNVYYSYRDLLVNQENRMWYPTGTCLPFGKKMFVTVNGKILPCERIKQEYALGHVDEKGIFIDIDGIVDMYNQFYSKYIPQCSKCYHNNTCKHCMFQNADLHTKAKCPTFMNKESFELYESDQLRYLSKHPFLYKRIMTEVIIH